MTRRDRTAFLDLPYRLYRKEPYWVPPLRSDQRRLVDRRANPFFDYGDVRLFLARRSGRAVGRIAAVTNPRHNASRGARCGFFGLFAAEDDEDVARALVSAACDALRAEGLETVLGPVNLTVHDELGVLLDAYDRWPAIGMPYNPASHPRLLEACGLTKAVDLLAWELPTTVHEKPVVGRLADLAAAREGLRLRPVDLNDFDGEARRMLALYNDVWDRNWGFSPMTEREFFAQARRLRPFLIPELTVFAELHGEPVGFALVLPDLAPAQAAAGGRLHTWGVPIGLLRFLRARRRTDALRIVALGVREEHRNSPIAMLLGAHISRTGARLGYRTAEASWVLETNTIAAGSLQYLGGQVTKTYRLYQRQL
ncbi:N-acetyltransferase [Streptomyces sp. NPDC048269]|uniref:N-acetyltransferase n=1 Tax=Streptomyces sp. NPDC048269 TaxID=3155753 RepID=UPI003421EB6B